jgi:hypothetical protein
MKESKSFIAREKGGLDLGTKNTQHTGKYKTPAVFD